MSASAAALLAPEAFIQLRLREIRAFKAERQLTNHGDYVLRSLLELVDYRDASRWTTITELGEYLDMNRRAVRRGLDELIEAGAIRWTAGVGGGRLEILVYDRLVRCRERPSRAVPRDSSRAFVTKPRGTARLHPPRPAVLPPQTVDNYQIPPLPPQSPAAGTPDEPTSGGEEVLLRNNEDQVLVLPAGGDELPERDELLAVAREQLEMVGTPILALRWDTELRAKPRSAARLVTALAEKRQAGWDLRAMLADLVVPNLPARIENSLIGLLATRLERLPEVPGGPPPARAERIAPPPPPAPSRPVVSFWQPDDEPIRWRSPEQPVRAREPDPEPITCRHCRGRFHPQSMATADACRLCAEPVGARS